MKKVQLVYNVYHENINSRKIETTNILGYDCIKRKLAQLRRLYKKHLKCVVQNGSSKYDSCYVGEVIFNNYATYDDVFKRKIFEPELRYTLMYYFWAKCECEIVLTDWPTTIKQSSTNTLYLKVANKIDMYNQVMNNWHIVLDYVWDNLLNADLRISRC